MTRPELIDALHDIEPHGKSQRLPELAEELTRTAAACAEPQIKERFVYAYRASGMLRPADIWAGGRGDTVVMAVSDGRRVKEAVP